MTAKTYLFVLAAVTATAPATARAGADRYGGIWNEGQATGPFVPAKAGMTLSALQSYMASWTQFRVTDIEIVPQGCPAEETDLVASQWEQASWNDRLEVYGSFHAFQIDVADQCDEGFKLIDFEIWDSACARTDTRYVALYTDAEGCTSKPAPVVVTETPSDMSRQVGMQHATGRMLVDFEASEPLNPGAIVGVFYAGSVKQRFGIYDRPAFEAEMLAADGIRTLDDMESYRLLPPFPGSVPTRYVAALWNEYADNRDDHEVGEVYGKFERLLFKDANTRRLVDFELYPNTYDRRFEDVFRSYLDGFSIAWAVSVNQVGEDVGSTASGLALRPDPGNSVPATPMTTTTRGVSASVTKFVTMLGVVAYANTRRGDWLDTRIVDILPSDFTSFGTGVDQLTLRDFLTQRTGLPDFSTGSDPLTDPAGFRASMVMWLQQPVQTPKPLPPQVLPFNYQNAHFDLLAIAMNEYVLPPLYPTSADPWRDWMNDRVFSKVGIGPRACGWQAGDASSYPLGWSTVNWKWMTAPYPCAGYGTGAAMFWISPDDMSRLVHGVRTHVLMSEARADEVLAIGLGLDHKASASLPYTPTDDGSGATLGEVLHSKNGGIGGTVNGEWIGSETFLVFYDDHNFDDDWGNANEYSYEIGYTEFDVGIAIHSAPFASDDICLYTKRCAATRLFPLPETMIKEAFRQPEAW